MTARALGRMLVTGLLLCVLPAAVFADNAGKLRMLSNDLDAMSENTYDTTEEVEAVMVELIQAFDEAAAIMEDEYASHGNCDNIVDEVAGFEESLLTFIFSLDDSALIEDAGEQFTAEGEIATQRYEDASNTLGCALIYDDDDYDYVNDYLPIISGSVSSLIMLLEDYTENDLPDLMRDNTDTLSEFNEWESDVNMILDSSERAFSDIEYLGYDDYYAISDVFTEFTTLLDDAAADLVDEIPADLAARLTQLTHEIDAFIATTQSSLDTLYWGDTTYTYPEFSDVPADNEFATDISSLVSLGIAVGYPDGTFKPKNHITRAEFMKLATKSAGVDCECFADYPSAYTDVAEGHSLEAYTNYASTAGLLEPRSGKFYPDKPITRGDAVVALLRAFKVEPYTEDVSQVFEDISDDTQWKYAHEAFKWGLVSGYAADKFGPNLPITREEAAKIIVRAMSNLSYPSLY